MSLSERQDLNLRPRVPKTRALTKLRYFPFILYLAYDLLEQKKILILVRPKFGIMLIINDDFKTGFLFIPTGLSFGTMSNMIILKLTHF